MDHRLTTTVPADRSRRVREQSLMSPQRAPSEPRHFLASFAFLASSVVSAFFDATVRRALPALALLMLFAGCGDQGGAGNDLIESACDNQIDDDLDNFVDCEDRDCRDDLACRTPARSDVELDCTNDWDDDGDRRADCADPDCADDPACAVDPASDESDCADGLDDDGDGATDCADSDCADASVCAGSEAICDDGIDNDGDGPTDCEDSDCAGLPICAGEEVDCTNGLDDDDDDSIDCADSDCAGDAACADVESACADGADNDEDEDTDCADDDCVGRPCSDNGDVCAAGLCTCPGGSAETVCDDGTDDDCDGQVDCVDSDCAAFPGCADAELDCDNGIDDDDDSRPDCQDDDCVGQSCAAFGRTCAAGSCLCPGGDNETSCNDGSDNDCDGSVDCGDSDCTASATCTEFVCDDGRDNDSDSRADCLDSDCAGESCGDFGRTCSGTSCSCPGGSTEICDNARDDNCNGLVDEDCEPVLVCPSPSSLSCGSSIRGTTEGGPRNISNMGCNAVGVAGPEASYRFTAPSSGDVTITLDGDGGLYPDLDLAIVGATGTDCDYASDCIRWGWGSTNDEEETFRASAGTTYYVIIDTSFGDGSEFSLNVACD